MNFDVLPFSQRLCKWVKLTAFRHLLIHGCLWAGHYSEKQAPRNLPNVLIRLFSVHNRNAVFFFTGVCTSREGWRGGKHESLTGAFVNNRAGAGAQAATSKGKIPTFKLLCLWLKLNTVFYFTLASCVKMHNTY